jgi:cell division protein FtsB
MKFVRPAMFLLSISLAGLLCALISRLWHAKKQEAHMLRRVEELTGRQKHLFNEFELKQDHMRKIISDGGFVEQLIREKTGFSKKNEMIFKFED